SAIFARIPRSPDLASRLRWSVTTPHAGADDEMDAHFQPINGISLERYADLGAAIADDMDDAAKVAAVLEAEGVALEDWEAAKRGWTARMQDMSLMGRVATAYMPLYQAAL